VDNRRVAPVAEGTGAVAALDCGTNSTRLLIVDAAGFVRAREMQITRLGQDVDRTHRLHSDAIDRTLDVLQAYHAAMDAEHVTRARLVATSAVRDAVDGERFLRSAEDVVGVEAELLSGDEEGRLSYLGATAELTEGTGRIVVVDIGGGSTELVLGPQDSIKSFSMDIGCVRLTERYLPGDPPSAKEVSAAVDAIGAELDRAVSAIPDFGDLGSGDRLVGLAGTVSTLAMLELDLSEYRRDRIHHAVLSRAAVERWCDVLGAETIAARARRASLPEGRQDVIFGGALILREIMRRFGVSDCLVSESDILDGLVLSLRRPAVN
jgi:exopolyphosphatase/guanosine-5'-triphosphate,3'-diphosphate pyrophosphatase